MRHPPIISTVPARRVLAGRCFTLIELMVSMAVLAVMMLMLFGFLVATQRAWSLSETTGRIYENARIAFDIVERDLLSSTVCAVPGEEIGFYVGAPNPDDSGDCLHACFVASHEPIEDNRCRLVEISYRYHHDPNVPATQYQLFRQMTSDLDTANWDFYRREPNWFRNDKLPVTSTYEKMVGGVAEFELLFYTNSDSLIAPGTDTTVSPSRAVINLVLFDELLVDAPDTVRLQHQRSFSKVLFLDRIIKN